MDARFEQPAGPDPPVAPVRDPTNRRLLWVLLGLGFLASLATIPFVASIRESLPGGDRLPSFGLGQALLIAVIETLLFTLPLAALGMAMLPKTGLPGAPLLRSVFAREPTAPRAILDGVVQGAAIGLGVALLLGGLDAVAPTMKPIVEFESPSWWRGLLGSFGAGIREEIWFRWGILTAITRALVAINRREAADPGMFWTANVGAALLFGAIHIPQAYSFVEVTPAAAAMVVGGNAVAGVGFGWIYRRRGLEAAMAAHTATDIVLHVILPAVAK